MIALRGRGLIDYVMPTIAFIVGAHFFGLARAMVGDDGRIFVWVGAAMCLSAAGIVYARTSSFISSAQSMALTGFACACILWTSALSTLI